MATDGLRAAIREREWNTILYPHLWRAYDRHRYEVLFYTLLFTLIAMPIATFFKWGETLVELLFGISLLTAVMPHGTPQRRRIIVIAVMLLLLARPVATEAKLTQISETALGLWAIIGLVAAAGALRFALTAEEVRSPHVHAALSAYLLAGIFFGVIYWAIEVALPPVSYR